jgi:hypothetical protein
VCVRVCVLLCLPELPALCTPWSAPHSLAPQAVRSCDSVALPALMEKAEKMNLSKRHPDVYVPLPARQRSHTGWPDGVGDPLPVNG